MSNDLLSVAHSCKMQDYDFVFSIDSIFLAERELYLKNPDTLFWSFLVDHPYYLYSRLLEQHNNQIVSCVDYAHIQYLRKCHPNIKYSCFMPHGGNIPAVSPKPFNEREYDVVLMGSYTNPQSLLEDFNQYPDLLKVISNQVIETYFSTYSNTLEDLFAYYFKEYQLNFSDEDFANVLQSLTSVDLYIRSKNREQILNMLTSNNITVDVFGSGWENYLCSNPENLKIHGTLPYPQAQKIMCNSKIILNPLPLFTNGSHVRVFTSMLCGAVCVSERNLYLQKEFTDKENICFFDMYSLDELPKSIKELLSEPAKAESIAQKSLTLATQKHTWEHRAKAIIEFVESISKS